MSNLSYTNYFDSEYQDSQDNHSSIKPERNLLAAVLSRAICDAFGSARCERHVIRSARQWIFSELTPKVPFSFAWIALQLDLDPAFLQNNLRLYEESSEDENIQERLAFLR
ncbi:MAG: hypothetical protein ACOX3T_07950 [Bdellovibrionota bacterium]